jgi:hypothetical protein
MLASSWVAAVVAEPEVDEAEDAATPSDAHQDSVGLDVPVENMMLVNELQLAERLLHDHKDGV